MRCDRYSSLTACVLAVMLLGFAQLPTRADDGLLPPMNGSPTDFAAHRAGAEVGASIRIGVTNDGIVRVTLTALTNAGVSATNLNGALLRLFCRTQEVALYVSSSGAWTTNDYLLFPGSAYDGTYTATNVYWLGYGPGGKRMSTRTVTPLATGAPVPSYRKTILYFGRNYLADTYRWNDASFDHWIDGSVSKNDNAATYSNASDQIVAGDSATLSATLYGFTSVAAVNTDHCTRILVNTTNIGQFFYDGQVTEILTTNFPGSLLKPTNNISFQQILQSGVTQDWAYVASFGMTYSRQCIQVQNALLFDGRAVATNYQVGGFVNATNFFLFDISDPTNAVWLTGFGTTNTGGGTNAVRFGDTTASTARYAVCQAAGLQAPASIERVFFRNLADTNRHADYIVICPYAFRQPVYRLLKLRYLQGLSVAVAPLPDIYNEFSYGIADAAAIKAFLGYAFHHWQGPPPAYALLAGIGTYDPRHFHPSWTVPDLIPVHMGPGYGTWTALDGWYAAVNGADNVPDIALGRIPAETADQLTAAVDKIVAFEGVPTNDPVRLSALLAADTTEPGLDFVAASDAIWTNILSPAGFVETFKAYRKDGPIAIQNVLYNLNYGVLIANYFGHGDAWDWGPSPPLLSTNDVPDLSNTYFPIMSMLSCANGAFHLPNTRCLVDALIQQANHGAVACVADSGLSTLPSNQSLANGLYGAMLTDRRHRIGDAMMAAYANLYLQNGNTTELLFFELFGDPAMVVNAP